MARTVYSLKARADPNAAYVKIYLYFTFLPFLFLDWCNFIHFPFCTLRRASYFLSQIVLSKSVFLKNNATNVLPREHKVEVLLLYGICGGKKTHSGTYFLLAVDKTIWGKGKVHLCSLETAYAVSNGPVKHTVNE